MELLLNRATYGATPELRAEVTKLGIPAWLDRQLDPESMPDPGGDATRVEYPQTYYPIERLEQLAGKDNRGPILVTDYESWTVGLHLAFAVSSSRHVREVVTGVWLDHLNVYPHYLTWVTVDYHQTVRKLALGRFEDLLAAVANHPAMVVYLNLHGSYKDNPNENFARELLELHTVGVDGGYTEDDIKQAAKLLTGFRYDGGGEVIFYPGRHYVGPVTVMGHTFPNATADGGPEAARELYRFLAHHPKTAERVAMKLTRHFVSDTPPPALVARLAKVYLDNDTEIAPVVRALFLSPEFAASRGEKVRRPFEYVVAVLRSLGARSNAKQKGYSTIGWLMGQGSGHTPFAWPTPDGYPDTAAPWRSASQALWMMGFVRTVAAQGAPTDALTYQDPISFLQAPDAATTPAGIADQLSRRFFGRPPTPAEAGAVTTLLTGSRLPRTYAARSPEQAAAITLVIPLLFQSPAFRTT